MNIILRSLHSAQSCQTRRHSNDLNFKLKIVIEAEAVNNNREIARESGFFQLMVSNQWFGHLKMTAKRASMDRHRPKDPELHQL